MRLAAALAIAASATIAGAAERPGGYPTRPLRLISPFAPGGGNDIMARAIGARLAESFGQQVVVDNRPGANGMVAAQIVAGAAPDGYTLFMANAGSHGINPSLYRKLPYDAIRDFTPVAQLGSTANVLVVHASHPALQLADLVALARTKPGQITYGSNGTGSTQHLAGVMFAAAQGIDLVHVPYKGTGPMLTDLLGPQITTSFANMAAVGQFIRSRQLRALALTGRGRHAALPGVPALAESIPGFEATSWWGVAGPARMPAAIVAALNAEIGRGLSHPATIERLEQLGVEPASGSAEQFAAFIRAEIGKWAKVVKLSGARAD